MKKKIRYEFIEHMVLRDAVQECLKRKVLPLDFEQVWKLWKLVKNKSIPVQWYNTSTLWVDGVFRNATLKDFENIEKIYEKGGRLLFALNDGDGFSGDNLLDDDARFVVEKSGGATKRKKV